MTSLKEFYNNKALIYEKYKDNNTANYYGTYVLSMLSVGKDQDQLDKNGISIRNRRTPLQTERYKVDRSLMGCRAAIEFSSNF